MLTTGSTAESGDYCEQNNSDYQVWASECRGKEEFCHYILCLHECKIITFTIFHLQENNYAEHSEDCVSLQVGVPPTPVHNFSDCGLGNNYCLIFIALLILSYRDGQDTRYKQITPEMLKTWALVSCFMVTLLEQQINAFCQRKMLYIWRKVTSVSGHNTISCRQIVHLY